MFLLIAWLLYGSISVFAIVFFFFFLKKKAFKYSFYRLVQCDLFLNLLTYISTWIRRLCIVDLTMPLMIKAYYNCHFLFHISGFCSDFFFHVQSISSITLCVHRFSTARFSNANQFWTKYYLVVYFFNVFYSATLVLTQYLFGIIVPVMYSEEKGSFVFEKTEPWQDAIYGKIFSITSKSYFTLIILFGIFTLLTLNQRFTIIQFNEHNKKIVKKMAIIAITHTVIYLTVILWNLFVSSSTIMMMTVSDIVSLSMPYILLICDKNVQLELRKKAKQSSVTTSVMMFMPKSSTFPNY